MSMTMTQVILQLKNKPSVLWSSQVDWHIEKMGGNWESFCRCLRNLRKSKKLPEYQVLTTHDIVQAFGIIESIDGIELFLKN